MLYFITSLGSWVYIRAFKSPPPRAFFADNYHLSTDELLASWLFFLAMLPSIPYCIIFIVWYPNHMLYWGSLVGSVFFVAATFLFVINSYPVSGENYTDRESDAGHATEPQYFRVKKMLIDSLGFKEDSRLVYHCQACKKHHHNDIYYPQSNICF